MRHGSTAPPQRARRPVPPPRPHDPAERELVAQVGPWQVRRLAHGSAKLEYCARRGFLHLQLWHPQAGVSVLTPSRLTGDQYDVAAAGRRLVVPSVAGLAAVLAPLRLQPPAGARLAALIEWHVRAIERRLARDAPAAGALEPPRAAPRSARS